MKTSTTEYCDEAHIMTQIPSAVTEHRQAIERQIEACRANLERSTQQCEIWRLEIQVFEAQLASIDLVLRALVEDAAGTAPSADVVQHPRRNLRALVLRELLPDLPTPATEIAERLGDCRTSQIENALIRLEREGKASQSNGGWCLRQEPSADPWPNLS